MVKQIDDFKEKFDFLFRPLIVILKKLKIKPPYISVISFIFGITSVFFLYSNHILFLVFALMHLFLDKLDGALARYTQNVTESGRWFDYILDSLVLFFLLVRSYMFFPSTGVNILFTGKFVLITLISYLLFNFIQIFIRKKNTFGSHLIAIILFIFKKYYLAILMTFLISIFGIIFHLIKWKDLHTQNE